MDCLFISILINHDKTTNRHRAHGDRQEGEASDNDFVCAAVSVRSLILAERHTATQAYPEPLGIHE